MSLYFFPTYFQQVFDNEYISFNNAITELENELFIFINDKFGSASSTAHALQLFEQFRSVLQQETLRELLDEKHKIIFNNYGRDVEAIKYMYENLCENPPIPRNSPPVSGNIAWGRQLLRYYS